jgi:LacI family transcriptional regulator
MPLYATCWEQGGFALGRGEFGAVLSVTIDDVALAAGVSIRTVSRVLNESPHVGAETRKTVLETIERLGYSPSTRARALASGRSFLIAMVQDDPNAHVIGALQRGIVEACSSHGYELVVRPVHFANPDIASDIENFVRRSRVDGLIVLPPTSEIAAIPERLTRLGVPSVGIASVSLPEYPCMLVSNERGATRALGQHLLELGHRRIAMIEGPAHFRSAQERKAGFLEGIGGSMPEAYRREGDYGFDSGAAAAEALLSLDQPPTAIFAANDIMAAAVAKIARERGVSVPGQLSLAGFDGSDIASMITPALTTIRRPLVDMAQAVTERLLDMISGARASWPHERIDLTLVHGKSVGPAMDDPRKNGR